MRGWIGIVLALCCALLMAGCAGARAQGALPVEALWPPGSVSSITVSLPAPAKTLILQTQGIENAQEGSIQINKGAWLPLNSQTFKAIGPGSGFGGIGGPVNVLTLQRGVNLAAGNVTLSFRFNGTDGVNSGFRIWNIAFLAANHAPIPVPLTYDDPNTWTPPLSDPLSVQAGSDIYHSTTLSESPLNPDQVNETCASCHTPDGYDLKYFNYSNFSISARAQFHGLTALQGQQVASYIRSLPYPNPGRPWIPAYQPGAGLDAAPLVNWAAGSNTFATDESAMTLLLASGNLSPPGSLNVREFPITLPLLPWNLWLPRRAPSDFWGTAWSDQHDADYQALASAPDAASYMKALEHQRNDVVSFYQAHIRPITAWTPDIAEAVYSTGQWNMARIWWAAQVHPVPLSWVYGSGPRVEARGIPGAQAFNSTPHELHIPIGMGRFSSPTWHYLVNCWYWLQLLLNPGEGQQQATGPIDWNYLQSEVYQGSRYLGPDAARLLVAYIKGTQGADNGKPPDQNNDGWSPLTLNPFQFGQAAKAPIWKDIPPAQRAQALQQLLDSWLAVSQQFSPAQYAAIGIGSKVDFLAKAQAGLAGLKAQGIDTAAAQQWLNGLIAGIAALPTTAAGGAN